ncbi:MAG: carboxypeptidase-like regulatory domain-containing protein [Pyrinomonadaceae bacterium]
MKQSKSKVLQRIGLCVVSSLICTLIAFSQNGQLAVVKGVATDVQNSRVPNAVVTFSNSQRSYETKTNRIGEYELSLEPGKYKVLIDGLSLGFDVTRRSEVLLASPSTKFLSFKLYSKFGVLGVNPAQWENDVADHPTIWPYSYQEVPFLSTNGISSGLIRYGTKIETGAISQFITSSSGQREGVTFSYDFFSVTADEIRLYGKTIYAFGSLLIEDENRTEMYKGKVKIRIEKGKAIFDKICGFPEAVCSAP